MPFTYTNLLRFKMCYSKHYYYITFFFFFFSEKTLENFTRNFGVKCLLTFGLFPLHYVFLALSILSVKHPIYNGIS